MEQQKSKCEHKKMIIIDEIIQCVSCGKTKYDIDREKPKESSWEEEFDKEFTADGGEEFGMVLTEIHPYRLKQFIRDTLDKQKEDIKEWALIKGKYISENDKWFSYIGGEELIDYIDSI